MSDRFLHQLEKRTPSAVAMAVVIGWPLLEKQVAHNLDTDRPDHSRMKVRALHPATKDVLAEEITDADGHHDALARVERSALDILQAHRAPLIGASADLREAVEDLCKSLHIPPPPAPTAEQVETVKALQGC